MPRLPLLQRDGLAKRDWMEPADIQEAFRIQRRFAWPHFSSLGWTVLCALVPGGFFVCHLLPRAAGSLGGEAPNSSWHCSSCLLWAMGALLGFTSAAFRNPGVVPSNAAPVSSQASGNSGNGGGNKRPPPPGSRYVGINAVTISLRWCHTCRIYRPPRVKHCAFCNRCIFRFDHHCVWLGNCVGLGNYRSFLLTVVAAALFFGHSALITGRVLVWDLRQVRTGAGEVLRRLFTTHVWKVLYITDAMVMSGALFILALYHFIIIGLNLTTNEHVRDYYLDRNPFHVTCADNYRQVFCAPYGRQLPIIRYDDDNMPSAALAHNLEQRAAQRTDFSPTSTSAVDGGSVV